jgi:hypothetical protein
MLKDGADSEKSIKKDTKKKNLSQLEVTYQTCNLSHETEINS